MLDHRKFSVSPFHQNIGFDNKILLFDLSMAILGIERLVGTTNSFDIHRKQATDNNSQERGIMAVIGCWGHSNKPDNINCWLFSILQSENFILL